MLDLKCNQENLTKFKNLLNCSFKLQELTANCLIKSINDRKNQSNLISQLKDKYYSNQKNCDKIEKFKNVPEKASTQILGRFDMQCSNETKLTKDLSSPLEKSKDSDLLSNLDEIDRLKSCSNQTIENKSNQLNGQFTDLNRTGRNPSISYAAKQETSSHQSTSQSTHSNETHNVHFATKNDKPSVISIGHFSVYLDRLDYEYRPSDTLTGKLHLLLESGQINLRRIVIYLKGISSVKFTEREYQSTSQNEKHFEDVEYWSDHFLLEQKTRPRLNDIKVLEPGEYHLPFKFVFPPNSLPSSYESPFGYIRYWIYAELRSKDKTRDTKDNHANDDDTNIATSELPVEVYSACSIPTEELRRPINAEQLKVMGCCTCLFRNPDFIQVRANLMHQGQRIGTSVQVNLFILNRSRKQITPYIILKARNEYRATNKTKINDVEIAGCPGVIVKAGETIMQTMLLPLSYDLPMIYDSPNITISYRIKIVVEVPNSFDINFPNLPIYLTNEKFPLRHNYV